MLRGAKQAGAKATVRHTVQLIVFSLSGKSFAMKADEVAGVEPWPLSMPIPGTTPFVTELVRRGTVVNPVYDLAGRWSLSVEELSPLCVLVKWGGEEVAIRVDSQIPSLESADADMIRPVSDRRAGAVGIWAYQGVDIPVVSFRYREHGVQQAA